MPFFQRAVDLDPNFAMAYVWMSIVYNELNEVGRAAENARKAYDLREKVSERERFAIEGSYYMIATGELEKAAQTYRTVAADLPERRLCLTLQLGIHFRRPGKLGKGIGGISRGAAPGAK